MLLVVGGPPQPEATAPVLNQVWSIGTVVRWLGVRYLISSTEVYLGDLDSTESVVYYRARVLDDAEPGSPAL